MVVEWITIDLKARWRIVEYALKSQLQEIGNSQEHLPVGARRQERPRLACGFCRLARGANGLAPGAARAGLEIFAENLFRRISDLDYVLFYKIDLFLFFRHIFFYK
ncbi:hypothetical protein P8452_02942 [Trifolium repens]|nr:hypothetical protein P8452_02942 [Trifolium repens]